MTERRSWQVKCNHSTVVLDLGNGLHTAYGRRELARAMQGHRRRVAMGTYGSSLPYIRVMM